MGYRPATRVQHNSGHSGLVRKLVLEETRFGGSVQTFRMQTQPLAPVAPKPMSAIRQERVIPFAHANRARVIRSPRSVMIARA